jgi:hypothetical protein
VALLANKGDNREEEERPNVPTSTAPVPALILLEVAVAAAALELEAGADLLGPAGRREGKKACVVTTKRSRAARPGRPRDGGMFWRRLLVLTGSG